MDSIPIELIYYLCSLRQVSWCKLDAGLLILTLCQPMLHSRVARKVNFKPIECVETTVLMPDVVTAGTGRVGGYSGRI